MGKILCLALMWIMICPFTALAEGGEFRSELELTENVEDSDTFILARDYSFIQSDGVIWTVPKGAIVDGASIPRALWSIIGSPWRGKYKFASVIHDYYCDTKERSWQKTHRVFYDGMVAKGVKKSKPK